MFKFLRLALYSFLFLIVGGLGFVLGALLLGDLSPNMLLEMISNETPQAKITRYLQAIQSQDRDAALGAWILPSDSSMTSKDLIERRDLITDELLSLKISEFTIFELQWWGTCCDPGVTRHARNAGGARVAVQVLDANGQPWIYTFDVFTNGSYYGDAVGNPYRHWFLRDVYPQNELPIFWPLLYSEGVRSP
jgi:hypothetical protein